MKFDSNAISEPVRQFGENLQKSISGLKLDNEKMKEALSTGLISQEEYRSWIALKFKEYQEITAQEIETSNPIEQAFITASKQILPPEVKTQIENDVKAYYSDIVDNIDKEFDRLQAQYENMMDGFQYKIAAKGRTWLEGGGNTDETMGGFFSRYFGNSPQASYRLAQEQVQGIYKILFDEYTKEKELLEAKMELLDKNSEEYRKYAETVEQITKSLETAENDYQAANIANIRQYGEDIKNMASDFTSTVGGLASAMGSYYTEQKEWAKDTYGENSAEYQKYLQKEAVWKKAQVWIDWATGVMTAWSTSEQLGPIAGPIMAALQTAALTTTALASVKMINRQAKTSGDGGGTANVGQLTDRVIMADAQRADQTAELNAKYNQGATRVYVTQGDIQDANNDNRVAVTQNRF